MQDLKNNNWIILDPLGNINEIDANLWWPFQILTTFE